MSQQFYSNLSKILFGFVVELFLLIANSEFLILHLLNPEISAYYYGYVFLLGLSAIFGLKYILEYRRFRETLQQGLFCPSDVDRLVNSSDVEPLDIPDDKALAVCTYYHNGSTMLQIQRNMGFTHPEQVKRHLLKGLDILLKEHVEKEQKQT